MTPSTKHEVQCQLRLVAEFCKRLNRRDPGEAVFVLTLNREVGRLLSMVERLPDGKEAT